MAYVSTQEYQNLHIISILNFEEFHWDIFGILVCYFTHSRTISKRNQRVIDRFSRLK